MIAPHPWLGFLQQILAWIFALEFGREISAQVIAHEFRAISQVAIKTMDFAERIMDSCVKGTCRDQCAELRDRLFEMHRLRDFARSPKIIRLKCKININRMARLVVA